MNIFFLVCGVFSFGMVINSYMEWNITAVIGWLFAMVFALLLSLQDLFEEKTEEQQKEEDKRIKAFNKLMNAANPKPTSSKE